MTSLKKIILILTSIMMKCNFHCVSNIKDRTLCITLGSILRCFFSSFPPVSSLCLQTLPWFLATQGMAQVERAADCR